MSHNTFGHLFRVTTWGESHGVAIGCVIDGCPSNIALDAAVHLQPYLDQRRPGTSRFVTQRQEPDTVEILSGIYEGKTTGTPICLMIKNIDQRSHDYSNIAQAFRPGHADFTYHAKYGIRDPRGGGRSSARETACRVAAGAVARRVLQHLLDDTVSIEAAVVQLGHLSADNVWQSDFIASNPLFCPNAAVLPEWEAYLDSVRKAGSSIGAVIQVQAHGVPAGLGAPLYGKLDADLAAAFMSINAVKGVEIGEGFAAAALRGEQNADDMRSITNFASNHAGGILGGISTGQPIVARFAVKPTSSILIPRDTVDVHGNPTQIATKGRHDPCVGIRAVPVGSAMMACVLADHALRHLGQGGRF